MALFAALALALLCGCQKPPAAPLRVGINPWPAHDLLWVAQQKGYFRELGLEVRLHEFPGLSDSSLSVQKQKLDVVALTSGEIAQSREPLVPVYVLDESLGLDAMIGGPRVRSLGDLRGKRVGIEPDSVGSLILLGALRAANLTMDDVDVVLITQSSGVEMMGSGMIDALVTYPPHSSGVLEIEGTRTVFDSSAMPGDIYDVLAARPAVREKRAEDIALLIQGYERALRLLRERPEEVYAMVARRYHLTVEETKASFETGMRWASPDEQQSLLAHGGMVEHAIGAARVALKALDGDAMLAGPDMR
ncbi:MAG: ABC transporter substrate-binding protein [Steroidobacteraceae bacterium]